MESILKGEGIRLQQSSSFQLDNVNVNVTKGKVVSILGPNGSGKSTLLRVLSRLSKVDGGHIELNGVGLETLSDKEISQQLAMLTQTQQNVVDITVEELVSYGRYPYRLWYRSLSEKDKEIISWALTVTHLDELKNRALLSLSGGERQRAWIAMAIAQMPEVLLLDEPTTYLDIKHQLEIMDLVKTLNRLYGMTVVMVLHDINQAYLHSDELVIMKDGKVYDQGKPHEVYTDKMFQEVFGVRISIFEEESNRLFNPMLMIQTK